jgi:hypothetical protein
MVEHIAQMGPMLILAGLAAGWMVAGGVAGGAIVWLVISSEAGMVTMFLIGCAAAALMIIAQRSFWRSARLGT